MSAGAIFTMLWLRLWRNPFAWIGLVLMPTVLFILSALAFGAAKDVRPTLRVAAAVTGQHPDVLTMLDTIKDDTHLIVSFDPTWTEMHVRERIRLGQDHVGFVIRHTPHATAQEPVLIIHNAGDTATAGILRARLSDALSTTPDKNRFTQTAIAPGAAPDNPAHPYVIYLLASVTALSLWLSAFFGAAARVESRNSGIAQRLVTQKRSGISRFVGYFAYVSTVAILQLSGLILAALLIFNIPANQPAFYLILIAAVLLTASFALLFSRLCRTPAQMKTTALFVTLSGALLGAAFVPGGLFPAALESVHSVSPTGQIIDGLYGTMARGFSVTDVLPHMGKLSVMTLGALAFYGLLSYRKRPKLQVTQA